MTSGLRYHTAPFKGQEKYLQALFHFIRELSLLEYAINTFGLVDLSRICIYSMKWIDVQHVVNYSL
jgi:hypothetical protein